MLYTVQLSSARREINLLSALCVSDVARCSYTTYELWAFCNGISSVNLKSFSIVSLLYIDIVGNYLINITGEISLLVGFRETLKWIWVLTVRNFICFHNKKCQVRVLTRSPLEFSTNILRKNNIEEKKDCLKWMIMQWTRNDCHRSLNNRGYIFYFTPWIQNL